MAFDGIMMSFIKKELFEVLNNARVSQINQLSRDEFVISFRTQQGNKKLLIRLGDTKRVHLTNANFENPLTPPMLCMLLRKKLNGAKLTDIIQPQFERILRFEFIGVNEIGDREKISLIVEFMGKYSNMLLLDKDDNVIEATKHIDLTQASDRVILPKMKYTYPQSQGKMSITDFSVQEICDKIYENGITYKSILNTVEGISPVIAREILFNSEKSADSFSTLKDNIESLKSLVQSGKAYPVSLIKEEDNTPFDVSFIPVAQYGDKVKMKLYDTFSELLDDFYIQRDKNIRMRAKTQDLSKLLNNLIERVSRKINIQSAELKKSADRELLRQKGDLLQANLYKIAKGAKSITVENFYSDKGEKITIELNPAITPAQNAQRFYKQYNKAKVREQMLTDQLKKANEELVYLESELDLLSRAEYEKELLAIRQELLDQGYIKAQRGLKQKSISLPPFEYTTSDGFKIFVGRNNRQNDALTLKTAKKNDMWFHTKDIPGSHTIVQTDNKELSEKAIVEAARVAAYHSKAKNSSNVPVDYTYVKYVSKPQNSKPGKVIYVNYKTVYVTPKPLDSGHDAR